MKNSLKITALLLTLLLLFGCFMPAACAADEESTNLVVLGDSIAAGTKLFNADVQCYGAMLAKTNGWNYENCAVPGHTTYAFSARLDEDGVKEAVKGADIIIVSIGGNNFLLNGLVDMIMDGLKNEDYSKMDEIISELYDSFDECILKIKALNPDAPLFVQTLYNPMTGSIGGVYQQGVNRLNSALKRYAEEHPGACTVVDIAPLFEGHSEYIATDYIHPNKKGHKVIAGEYQRVFYEMGLSQTEEVIEPTFSEIISIDIVKFIQDKIFQLTNSINLMIGGLQ